jgi:hypothetical protein
MPLGGIDLKYEECLLPLRVWYEWRLGNAGQRLIPFWLGKHSAAADQVARLAFGCRSATGHHIAYRSTNVRIVALQPGGLVLKATRGGEPTLHGFTERGADRAHVVDRSDGVDRSPLGRRARDRANVPRRGQ